MGFVVMDEAFDEWKAGKTPHGYGRFFDEWSERDLASMLAPRPQSSLRRAVEHRQRNPRAGRDATATQCPSGWSISATARTPRGPRSRPATIPAGPTARALPSRWTFSASTTISAPTGSIKGKYNLVGSETASALSTRGEYGLVAGEDGKVQIQPGVRPPGDLLRPGRPGLGLHRRDRPAGAGRARPGWPASSSGPASTTSASRRPIGWPSRSSYFGIVDLAGFPKDRYYFYRSVWRPEPLVHLLPHWNWPGLRRQGDPRLGRHAIATRSSCSSTASRWARRSSTATSRCTSSGRCPTPPGIAARPWPRRAARKWPRDEVRTAGQAEAAGACGPTARSIAADGDDLSFVEVQRRRRRRAGLP